MTLHVVKWIGVAIAAPLVIGVAGCSPDRPAEPLGPPTPSGATLIPGGPMENAPEVKDPKIPGSQQEAQDTVLRYLQQTVDALPTGSTLDGSRLTVGHGATYCENEPADHNAPVHFEDWRDVVVPAGTDSNVVVAQIGEAWKAWGWEVREREGFPKPNRFGYAPDGYILQIKVRTDPQKSLSLIGSSPCFSGSLRQDDAPRNPVVITQSPAAR